ncbi:hypothetical protein, partial [Photobacterium leiognathi]|uniref:hypothetical protein n=1 Tax=Photobacterium leiognathi TaxID=553611 RepID=UPI0005B7DEC6
DSVDASLAAFASVQLAATNSDASSVNAETLNAIRGLTVNDAHLGDYQEAIEAQSSIVDVAALQAVIDEVDASLAAFANVQSAALSNNAGGITTDVLNDIIGLTFTGANLADYQVAIESENEIADVSALQALIDNVDNTVGAFAAVQAAATNSDASGLTLTILSNIDGLNYTDANFSDYQSAIAAESSIADVAALQALIDSVDASLSAFAAVQSAATSSDVSGISSTTLSNIIGLTFDSANLSDYQGAIAAEVSIADVAALQALINSVDSSVSAFAAVQLAASSSDASGISSATLSNIIGLTFDAANLTDYQTAIVVESSIADVAALQALINSVDASLDAFAAVQAAATSSDASGISPTTLSSITGLTFDSANLTDYQDAIAAEASIADVAALQALINSVDASIAAFESVQLATLTGDASTITAESLADIIGLTFSSANVTDYQDAIAVQSNIADVAALQALIDSVDASLAAFAAVQSAATSSDGSGISSATLSDIIGLTFDSANLADYQDAIAAESSIADVNALQVLIDSVDASVLAFVSVQQAAINSDASSITASVFGQIRGLIFSSGNMLSYRSAIEGESTIADVVALQALIDSVDASLAAFASVQAAASSSDASSVTVDTLNAIRGLTFGGANIADYQAAIAAESSIADVAALQALLDSVDASLSGFAAVQAAATNSDASG